MEYQDILHRCFRCGYCKLPGDYYDFTCPSYLNYRFETFSPGGRMWLLRAWLTGEIRTSQRLGEIMFSCATCANCVEHCAFPKFKDDLLNAIIAGREALVDEGTIPPAVRDYFKAMHVAGNPFKEPADRRGQWAEGRELNAFDGQEYLFYVGDVGAYDERGKKMAGAVAALLKKLDISFGILGSDETSHGNEVRAMGETGLFQFLAEQTIKRFKERGVGKIITLSPHAFNAFKNDYPALGGTYEVFHYSQILARRFSGAELTLKGNAPLTVTFHDPCYLGRHNSEYQAPRAILQTLPGVRLVEMDRSRKNALCCGGGGGNFFTDILGRGPDSPARNRVREAVSTGAEFLVAACPQCLKMLEDAVKAEGLETRIKAGDPAELIDERFGTI